MNENSLKIRKLQNINNYDIVKQLNKNSNIFVYLAKNRISDVQYLFYFILFIFPTLCSSAQPAERDSSIYIASSQLYRMG